MNGADLEMEMQVDAEGAGSGAAEDVEHEDLESQARAAPAMDVALTTNPVVPSYAYKLEVEVQEPTDVLTFATNILVIVPGPPGQVCRGLLSFAAVPAVSLVKVCRIPLKFISEAHVGLMWRVE